jgi:hypothetical protein
MIRRYLLDTGIAQDYQAGMRSGSRCCELAFVYGRKRARS